LTLLAPNIIKYSPITNPTSKAWFWMLQRKIGLRMKISSKEFESNRAFSLTILKQCILIIKPWSSWPLRRNWLFTDSGVWITKLSITSRASSRTLTCLVGNMMPNKLESAPKKIQWPIMQNSKSSRSWFNQNNCRVMN